MADALTAHEEAMRYGGRDGIASLQLIESALARPYSGYHRSIFRKSAAALESLVANHGFVDGNKRTAWLLVELLIDRSDCFLDVPQDERIDDLVVAVATGEMQFDELVLWFKDRLRQR